MSSRADKAQKNQKDRHHTILRELVQEVPNKTCAECLAKGPRWASWSLGVFVCIRCAGIHRNLGVHISKMKSIDLDSWTPEQLDNMLKWGNKRAAEYYECYLPKDFVRPQTNHALESFIRNKYEKKLYIKKDGEPEPNPQSKLDRRKTDQKEEKGEKDKKTATRQRRREEKKKDAPTEIKNPSENTILNMATQKNTQNSLLNVEQNTKSHSMNDLLSLDAQQQQQQPQANDIKHSASANDLLNFGAWSEPVASSTTSNDPFVQTNGTTDPFASASQNDNQSSDPFQSNTTTSAAPAKSTKESILSLYSSGSSNMVQQQHQQQQMYGVPGSVYMPNFQNQGVYGQQQNQMQMNQMNQMNQLNMQMQQMNFKQPMPQQQMVQNQMMQGQMRQGVPAVQNMYNQQGMYQQQPQNMMNMQMNNAQNNFALMGQQQQQQQQQQQGMMGNNWGVQQGMMGMGQQQGMMSNGNMGNFGMNSGMSNTGQTMNNSLWN